MIGLSHSIHPHFIHKWLYCYHFLCVHITIWFDVMIEIFFPLSLGRYFLYSCCFVRNVFSIENRIFICERPVFFHILFIFSLCGVLMHAWTLHGMNENVGSLFNSLTIFTFAYAEQMNESERDGNRSWLVLSLPTQSSSEPNEWNQMEFTFGTFDWIMFLMILLRLILLKCQSKRQRESFDGVSLDIYKIIKIVCILFQNSWNGSHFWFTFWRTIHKNYNSTMAITIITKYKWNQAKCQPAVVIKEISQNRTFQQAYAWTHHNEHWTKWTIPNGFSKRLFDILFILADYRLCYKHRMRLK